MIYKLQNINYKQNKIYKILIIIQNQIKNKNMLLKIYKIKILNYNNKLNKIKIYLSKLNKN